MGSKFPGYPPGSPDDPGPAPGPDHVLFDVTVPGDEKPVFVWGLKPTDGFAWCARCESLQWKSPESKQCSDCGAPL